MCAHAHASMPRRIAFCHAVSLCAFCRCSQESEAVDGHCVYLFLDAASRNVVCTCIYLISYFYSERCRLAICQRAAAPAHQSNQHTFKHPEQRTIPWANTTRGKHCMVLFQWAAPLSPSSLRGSNTAWRGKSRVRRLRTSAEIFKYILIAFDRSISRPPTH